MCAPMSLSGVCLGCLVTFDLKWCVIVFGGKWPSANGFVWLCKFLSVGKIALKISVDKDMFRRCTTILVAHLFVESL